MEVRNPRRILVVGAPDSGALDVVKELTGSTPPLNDDGSTAGLTHEWHIRTTYYTANIPLWLDEITNVDAWKAEFMKPEAKEVVTALGAWIYCFRPAARDVVEHQMRQALQAIQEICEEHAGYAADVIMLAASIPFSKGEASASTNSDTMDLEDICISYGFEYINWSDKGTNDFREKVGIERFKEALEANEWNGDVAEDDADFDFDELQGDAEDDTFSFAHDEAAMTAELYGLKAALANEELDPETGDPSPGAQEDQVDDLDMLMAKLLAVREQSADLPEAQKKRMAAQAVQQLIRHDD